MSEIRSALINWIERVNFDTNEQSYENPQKPRTTQNHSQTNNPNPNIKGRRFKLISRDCLRTYRNFYRTLWVERRRQLIQWRQDYFRALIFVYYHNCLLYTCFGRDWQRAIFFMRNVDNTTRAIISETWSIEDQLKTVQELESLLNRSLLYNEKLVSQPHYLNYTAQI